MTTSAEKFEELFRREACLVDEFPEEADLEYIMDRDDKRRRRLRAETDHVATALTPKLRRGRPLFESLPRKCRAAVSSRSRAVLKLRKFEVLCLCPDFDGDIVPTRAKFFDISGDSLASILERLSTAIPLGEAPGECRDADNEPALSLGF